MYTHIFLTDPLAGAGFLCLATFCRRIGVFRRRPRYTRCVLLARLLRGRSSTCASDPGKAGRPGTRALSAVLILASDDRVVGCNQASESISDRRLSQVVGFANVLLDPALPLFGIFQAVPSNPNAR
jgi:hypothetical protein